MIKYFAQTVVNAGTAPLNPSPKNVEGWENIGMDPSERSALDLSEKLEDYIMAFASTADITHDEDHENSYSANRYHIYVKAYCRV